MRRRLRLPCEPALGEDRLFPSGCGQRRASRRGGTRRPRQSRVRLGACAPPPNARLLSQQDLYPAPMEGSPFCEWLRRRLLAAWRPRSLPWPLFRPAQPCVARFTIWRFAPSSFASHLNVATYRRHGSVLRAVAGCSQPLHTIMRCNATAMAPRSTNGIAIQRSALRVIEPCSSIRLARIVSLYAKRRSALPSPALLSPFLTTALFLPSRQCAARRQLSAHAG